MTRRKYRPVIQFGNPLDGGLGPAAETAIAAALGATAEMAIAPALGSADLPVLLTLPECERLLRCGSTKLTRLIRSGEVASTVIGGSRRVLTSSVLALLAAGAGRESPIGTAGREALAKLHDAAAAAMAPTAAPVPAPAPPLPLRPATPRPATKAEEAEARRRAELRTARRAAQQASVQARRARQREVAELAAKTARLESEVQALLQRQQNVAKLHPRPRGGGRGSPDSRFDDGGPGLSAGPARDGATSSE